MTQPLTARLQLPSYCKKTVEQDCPPCTILKDPINFCGLHLLMFRHFLIISYLHNCMYLWEGKTNAFCAYSASSSWIICSMSPSFMLPLAAWRRKRTSAQQPSLTQPLRNWSQTTSKNGASCSWKSHCNQLCMITFECLFLPHLCFPLLCLSSFNWRN